MYFGVDARETVSVMGTPAFMDFVESLQTEGITFERAPMGAGVTRQDSLIVEVDAESPDKDLDALDIPLPRLSRRFQRDFKELGALDPSALGNKRLPLKPFTRRKRGKSSSRPCSMRRSTTRSSSTAPDRRITAP
jgi:type III restriction enzyme